MKRKINLQLFSEGGAGTGASTGAALAGDSGAVSGVSADPAATGGDEFSNVVYGVSNNQEVATPKEDVKTTNDIKPADRQKAFDEMVKKGGEYADAFNKRTQDIINKRFKETKSLEEKVKSFDSISQTLAAKYGVDASDPKALEEALNNDTSMFEEMAFKEGLTPEQYRQKRALEQENARLKAAQEEAAAQSNADRIYAGWIQDSEKLVEKYGIQNFDLATEMQNPEFTDLLAAGVTFEGAYKTIHFDDMINGAMASTAANVSQAMVNNIQSRSRRPAENGTLSASNKVFKSDPSKLQDKDFKEIEKRLIRGEKISFG